MLNQLECEIRFFHQKCGQIYGYSTKFESWSPENKSLRIREWKFKDGNNNLPCEVLFSKRTIKNVKCAYGGKAKLFEGSFEDCKGFLKDLGFEFWFKTVKRNCKVFKMQDFSFAFEFIEMEIRENSLEKVNRRLRKLLSVLKIPKSDVSFKTLASIYLKSLRS